MRSHPNGDLAGVRVLLDGAGDTQPALPLGRHRPDLRGPVAHDGHRRRGRRPLQRLHDGGRAADRLGLLRAGPRRPDRQVQDRQLDLRLATAASSGTSTPTRRTSTRSTTSRPTARPSRRRSATSARLNDGSFNVGVNSGGEYEYKADANKPALLHPRQAHRRAGHPALHGRRPLARRRRPADARRRARRTPVAGTADGFATCTFDLKNTGAAAATRRTLHPQDAVGVLRQRHLPPVGVGVRHRLDRAPAATRSPPRSSARPSRCRSTSRRRPARRPPAPSR